MKKLYVHLVLLTCTTQALYKNKCKTGLFAVFGDPNAADADADCRTRCFKSEYGIGHYIGERTKIADGTVRCYCCPGNICQLPGYKNQGYKDPVIGIPIKGAGFPTGEYLKEDKCPYIANIEYVWKREGSPDIVEKAILYRCKDALGEIKTIAPEADILLWDHCKNNGYDQVRLNGAGKLECIKNGQAPQCGNDINKRINQTFLLDASKIKDKRD